MHLLKMHLRCINAVGCVKNDTHLGAHTKCMQFSHCIVSLKTHCRTVFQNWQDKTQKTSPDEQFIMEYPPGLPQDTKSLRSCPGDQAKMLLKGQLRISQRKWYHGSKHLMLSVKYLLKFNIVYHELNNHLKIFKYYLS